MSPAFRYIKTGILVYRRTELWATSRDAQEKWLVVLNQNVKNFNPWSSSLKFNVLVLFIRLRFDWYVLITAIQKFFHGD